MVLAPKSSLALRLLAGDGRSLGVEGDSAGRYRDESRLTSSVWVRWIISSSLAPSGGIEKRIPSEGALGHHQWYGGDSRAIERPRGRVTPQEVRRQIWATWYRQSWWIARWRAVCAGGSGD